MLTIAHLTDFSAASSKAFVHALRLAIAHRNCRLFILHSRQPFTTHEWALFPHVRETLSRWGYMKPDEPTSAIEQKTGVKVAKVEIDTVDLSRGIEHFLTEHRPELLVMATAGREGLPKWLRPSKAESIFHRTHVPTLFMREQSDSFVTTGGQLKLDRIIIPVADELSAHKGLEIAMQFLMPLGLAGNALDFIHIGNSSAAPRHIGAFNVRMISGPIIADQIVNESDRMKADMIVMPTTGMQNLFKRLRGSTTEQVVHHARCPVLAIPI